MDELCRINRWEMLKKRLNNLSPQEFLDKLNLESNAILIDCRQPSEFQNEHIRDAINIDYFGDGFYEQLEQLDRDQLYLVYCRSGRRSLRTCTLMQNSGFTAVYNLEGGLKRWHDEIGDLGKVNKGKNE